jgi:hypothetical protein
MAKRLSRLIPVCISSEGRSSIDEASSCRVTLRHSRRMRSGRPRADAVARDDERVGAATALLVGGGGAQDGTTGSFNGAQSKERSTPSPAAKGASLAPEQGAHGDDRPPDPNPKQQGRPNGEEQCRQRGPSRAIVLGLFPPIVRSRALQRMRRKSRCACADDWPARSVGWRQCVVAGQGPPGNESSKRIAHSLAFGWIGLGIARSSTFNVTLWAPFSSGCEC